MQSTSYKTIELFYIICEISPGAIHRTIYSLLDNTVSGNLIGCLLETYEALYSHYVFGNKTRVFMRNRKTVLFSSWLPSFLSGHFIYHPVI